MEVCRHISENIQAHVFQVSDHLGHYFVHIQIQGIKC